MLSHLPPGPPNPRLDDSSVHVWMADLHAPGEHLDHYASLLAHDERERAARFHFERHRDHFVAGRGILRTLLALYLDQAPEAVQFSYTDFGKPFLAKSNLQFNLAHCGNVALFAFCLQDAVGIDVERQRELPDALAIAGRFFSPRESETLRALPPAEQTAAFFRCWTRKEAFIKAVGEGLSYPLAAFDVTLAPREEARLLAVRGSASEAAQWTLLDLRPAMGYEGALVVKGKPARLRRWRFQR